MPIATLKEQGPVPTVPPDAGSLAMLARALGHPARLAVIQLLLDRQTCIGCDIVDEIGLAQSTTSEHLRILKVAGIISGEVERPRICYALCPEALEPLRDFLQEITSPAGQSQDQKKIR